jgi:heat shock protein HslJ
MAAAGSRIAAFALLCTACTSVTASQATFDGTRWHVTAVNAQPTPTGADYSMQFAAGNIGARFGCNHIGGRYSALGDTLRTFDVHTTLMGCPEPAATFEHQGSAVLTSPMRIAWNGERRVTFSNSNGSIALELIR